MRRFWRFLGLPALAAALISALNLAPVFAQGMYPGGGYNYGSGSMPYRAPAPYGGSGYRSAPSYQSPNRGYPTNRMQYGMPPRYSAPHGYGNGGYNTYGMPPRYSAPYGYGNRGYNAYGNRAVLYTVQFGDTLAKIARRFGTSVSALLRANPAIVDPDVIYAGQTLVIPTASYGANYSAGSPYAAPRAGYPPSNYAPPQAVPGPYGMPAPAPYGMPAPAPYGMPAPGPYQMPAPAPAPVPAPAPAPAPGTTQTATIDLTARNMAFSLSTIAVPAGAQVVVDFDNQDVGVPHNFAVYTDSSAQQVIFRGQIITGPGTTTYIFTAPSQPGTYFFRCDVHFTMMTGQFVVR